jgi:hypothetical protein
VPAGTSSSATTATPPGTGAFCGRSKAAARAGARKNSRLRIVFMQVMVLIRLEDV